MNDSEFNKEIEDFLKIEAVKQPFYTESIAKELGEVTSAFQDEYVSLVVARQFEGVEDFFGVTESLSAGLDTERGAGGETYIDELDRSLQVNLEKYPLLTSGEIQVSGDGVFLCCPKPEEASQYEDDTELDILSDGATLIGEVKYYSVEDFTSFEAYKASQTDQTNELDEGASTEVPSILLHMKNTVAIEPNGAATNVIGDVIVPVTFSSLHFEKVFRLGKSTVAEAKVEKPVEVITHFKSDFIAESCMDMENDLNYNDYTVEECQQYRESHQDELDIYMSAVDRDKPLVLNAFEANFFNSDRSSIAGDEVFYLGPVFIKHNDTWRAAHSFSVPADSGPHLAHVLPEHILDICYASDK